MVEWKYKKQKNHGAETLYGSWGWGKNRTEQQYEEKKPDHSRVKGYKKQRRIKYKRKQTVHETVFFGRKRMPSASEKTPVKSEMK